MCVTSIVKPSTITTVLVVIVIQLLTGQVRGAEADSLTDSLPKRAIRRYGTPRYRHGEHIVGLTVSPNGKFAVAFGRSSGNNHQRPRARIYDLRNGQKLAGLPGRANAIEAAAISPDGKVLATKQGRGIHLHNPKTGAEIEKFTFWLGNPRSVTYWLCFSPDGSKLALSSGTKECQIVDLKRKKVLHKLTHGRTVYAGVFSPDGKLFAAGGNHCVRLWAVDTGQEVRRLPYSNPGLNTLAFSPDGKILAGGGAHHPARAPGSEQPDSRLRLWNVATGKVIHDFKPNGSHVRSVAFAHNGKTIASAGDTIRIYDVATKELRLRIPERAIGLHFSPSDDVLTAAVDGAIYRWETKTGKLLTPPGCNSGIDQIAVANNGRTLVTRNQAGVVHLWNLATGKPIHQMRMDHRSEFAVSPNGRHLVMSKSDPYQWKKLKDPKLKLYDLKTGRFIKRFAENNGYSHDKELSRDGKTLVTIDQFKGKVRLWDVATGRERHSFSPLREEELNKFYLISGSILSPDGKTLAVAYRRFDWKRPWTPAVAIRLWDIATGKELAQFNGHTRNIHALAFSPDGRFVASSTQSSPGAIHNSDAFVIWDVNARKPHVRLSDRESQSPYRVAFSPNGRLMASASLDGTVQIWEVASWTIRTSFQAHRDHITALHFSPDGGLYTGSFDTTVLAWNLRPDKAGKNRSLAKAWTELLGRDSKSAYAIQGRLLATPKDTVAFFTKKLRPVVKVDTKRVEKLLADLDSNDFATRQVATSALREFRHRIEPTLRKTLARTTSAEVRGRVQSLLSNLATTTPAELRILRAVEVLEWLATPPAREQLSKLAKGEPTALLTRSATSAVERLRARGQ